MKYSALIAGIVLAGVSVSASAQPGEIATTAPAKVARNEVGLPSARPAVDDTIEFPTPHTNNYPRRNLFVEPRNVAMVTKGMTKRQVYALLPPPHFGEGLFGVRKWNYVFNFYTSQGSDFVTCQYQIHYDKNGRVEGTWFKTQKCADWLNYLLGTPGAGQPASE